MAGSAMRCRASVPPSVARRLPCAPLNVAGVAIDVSLAAARHLARRGFLLEQPTAVDAATAEKRGSGERGRAPAPPPGQRCSGSRAAAALPSSCCVFGGIHEVVHAAQARVYLPRADMATATAAGCSQRGRTTCFYSLDATPTPISVSTGPVRPRALHHGSPAA